MPASRLASFCRKPQMRRAALVVAVLLQLTSLPAHSQADSDSPASTFAYIVSPNDGRWLFSAGLVGAPHSSLRFEAVVIHYGVTRPWTMMPCFPSTARCSCRSRSSFRQ